ncbi:MAG: hypothetical protein AAF430_11600 [Myxococcota bacterium]
MNRPVLRCMLAALALTSSVACNGPFLLLPGGTLQGDAQPAPADWGFAGDAGIFELETNPSEPYSVNLAYTVIDGRLLLNAGDTETQWVQNMDADPNVRLRLDGTLYEAHAARIDDEALVDAFSDAWTNQSMFRRDPRELERVWIYELTTRP